MISTHLIALFLGFCLDLLIGDPYSFPHPVKLIGNLIAVLEKIMRTYFPETEDGEKTAGLALVVIMLIVPAGLTLALILLCESISPWLSFAVQTVLCYQLLAAKCLKTESMKVYSALKNGSLTDARSAVSMIVGRDTENLDAEAIVKATVETVAENTSDGVIAPLLFIAIGGAPLGMLYKAVNTMDSMVGYKNDKYLHFGHAAAKLDDLLNFIPARIAGLIMCLAALLAGFNADNAIYIFRRDRLNHKSPNSAHTEAACAGALGIALAGPSSYFGEMLAKPTIGDPLKLIEAEDIPNSCRLMYATAILALLIFCVFPLFLSMF